jgi:heat shock protein HslJ
VTTAFAGHAHAKSPAIIRSRRRGWPLSQIDRTPVLLLALLVIASTESRAQVMDGEWRPIEIANIAVPSRANLFVRFNATGKLEGFGGCNKFFGVYSTVDDGIKVGALGATKMACREPVMTRETHFLAALENAKRFGRQGISLTLYDVAGNIMVRFTRIGTE